MEDYMSFKQALRGFDRDEVLEFIRRQDEEANARIAALEKEIRKRDKVIAELKNRIVLKDSQVDRMETDIRNKYQKYIENYRQIGDLVYESKLKGQRIIEEAHSEANRIIANADAEAKKRVAVVQGQIDQKLTDGKKKYLAVQDEMNEIVDMFNQMQRKFMQSYKEVHEIIQSMPVSLSDFGDNQEGEEDDYDVDIDFDLRSLGIGFDDDFDSDDPDEFAEAEIPQEDDRIEDTGELAILDGAAPTDVKERGQA